MSAIEILGIEKTYSVGFWRKQTKCALKPLHLTVEDGEVFGFLGPNGAGKTTTLKLLMGLMYPTGGSARILGMEINDPRMKAQIGFLPEQPYFYDYLTARELLDYYGRLSGVPAKDLPQRISAVLDRVGLASAATTQLRKFSKGMLQRAGIAQAILHDPKVVFLDEPMSGLDPMGRAAETAVAHAVMDLVAPGAQADRQRCRTPNRSVLLIAQIKDVAGPIADGIVGPRRQLVLPAVQPPAIAAAVGGHLKAEGRIGDDIGPRRRGCLPGP